MNEIKYFIGYVYIYIYYVWWKLTSLDDVMQLDASINNVYVNIVDTQLTFIIDNP